MNQSTDNELEGILAKLPEYNLGQDPITGEDFTAYETFAVYPELNEALTALHQREERLCNEARVDEQKRTDGAYLRFLKYEGVGVGEDSIWITHDDRIAELTQPPNKESL